MNILLINPRFNGWTLNICVPLGLGYLAQALVLKWHDVRIIDINASRIDKREYYKALSDADIIGLTGMVTEYGRIISLAQEVRRNSNAVLVIGGPLASSLPRQVLDETDADVLVINEGEATIVELCDALRVGAVRAKGIFGKLSFVRGLVYNWGGSTVATDSREYIENIDMISFPARQLMNMDFYIKDYRRYISLRLPSFGRGRGTNMISSRGCPFSCTFCSRVPWGRKWRPRSAENIVAEMEMLNDKYGISEFVFYDDNFTLDRKRVMELCALMVVRGLNAIWSCNSRVDIVDREMLDAMFEAGCRSISYGLESGNQGMLDRMKKNTTPGQAREAIAMTKRAGISATGYFILGMEGETRKSVRDTFDFARELPLDFYSFSFLTVLPGSELYDRLGANIRGYREYSTFANCNLTNGCTDRELAGFGRYAFREFYLKRRYGQHYYFSPKLWHDGARVLANIARRGQLGEFVEKFRALLPMIK